MEYLGKGIMARVEGYLLLAWGEKRQKIIHVFRHQSRETPQTA